MQKLSLLIVLLALGSVLVAAMPAERLQKQTAHECILKNNCFSRDWEKKERADAGEMVRLVFAIRQQNLDKIEEILMEVSTPDHPKYGQHLSHEEIGQLTRDVEALNGVQSFLKRHGVNKFRTTSWGDFIIARMTVAKAEELLACKFFKFYSAAKDIEAIRTLEYSLPRAVFDFIDYVGYTVQFPATLIPKPMIRSYSADALAASGVATPDLIASYYHITTRTVQNSGSTQSLFESLGQDFSPTDLATFQKKYSIPADPVKTIIGPNKAAACNSNPNNCVEANLDVQYIMAIAEGAETTYWSIPQSASDIFLEWILAVSDASSPPLVHSMSYGSIESEEVQSDMQSFNTAAMKLGTQGLSILIASGDDGVANFNARGDPSACGFNPSYPATVPYITAVGATQGPEAGTTEIACSSKTGGLITTGGGFSAVFTQPNYQSAAVAAYFKSSVTFPPSNQYNGAGRGYPDVALVGHNFDVCIAGQFYEVSGTSCSTPTTAGMITLINDARLSAGQSPLGFLNPLFYNLAGNATTTSPFNDITSGENNCCAGNPGQETCCKYGFYAAPGWDPLTGWGSINFANLLAALK